MVEHQIAVPLMFFGAVLMPYSLYGYPPLQRRVGTLRLTRWGLAAAVAACLIIPAVANIAGSSYVGAMVRRAWGKGGPCARRRAWALPHLYPAMPCRSIGHMVSRTEEHNACNGS